MIINKQKMIENISNFYKDHGIGDAGISFFIDLYEEMGKAIDEYIFSVKRNQNIRTMEAFRKYNLAVFPASDAQYVLETLLSNISYTDGSSLSGTIQDKVFQWTNVIPVQEKISILDKAGKYIRLSAKRVFDDIEPEIIGLELQDVGRGKLLENIDYILRDNKVYLIGDRAYPSSLLTYLTATNIFVDYNTPERFLGSRIGIGYSEKVTKPEYRDFIQMAAYVLMNGPSIRNIKDAFNMIAGWEGAGVVDRVSATGAKKDMWDKPGYAVLTPFDFLVTIPASSISMVGLSDTGEMIYKEDRIDVFNQFLNVVKPTDTNYIIALTQPILEEMDINENVDITRVSRFNSESDGLSTVDITAELGIDEVSTEGLDEDDFYDPLLLADVGDNEYVDTLGLAPIDVTLGGYLLKPSDGADGFGDAVFLTHIDFPEYPLSFTASKVGNFIVGSIQDNAEGTDGYVIFADNDVFLELERIGGGVIEWNKEIVLLAGTVTFHARSFYTDGGIRYYSRPSEIVPVTIT